MNNEELRAFLAGVFADEGFVSLRWMEPEKAPTVVEANGEVWRRVEAKPIVVKGARRIQFAFQGERQVTHRNLDAGDAAEQGLGLLTARFRQARVQTTEMEILLRRGPNGRITHSRKAVTFAAPDLRHDRTKVRVLQEGTPVPFLVRLGIMTPEGRIVASRQAKWKQINRFVEMVADVYDDLPAEGILRVVDYGSGKSYLTFALHHYLTLVRGRDVAMVGLDLKADVIAHCETLARDTGCEGLHFALGDIARHESEGLGDTDSIDLMVSLHACDGATDAALAQAVRRHARVILSVPCCQHELNRQLENATMRPLLKHGLFRERLNALVTDALRAEALEAAGYAVQVLEFVEEEHTAKNVLLRAVRKDTTSAVREAAQREYENFRAFWNVRGAMNKIGEGVID